VEKRGRCRIEVASIKKGVHFRRSATHEFLPTPTLLLIPMKGGTVEEDKY